MRQWEATLWKSIFKRLSNSGNLSQFSEALRQQKDSSLVFDCKLLHKPACKRRVISCRHICHRYTMNTYVELSATTL